MKYVDSLNAFAPCFIPDQCNEPTNVPSVKYNFVPLSGLEELPKDSICGWHLPDVF